MRQTVQGCLFQSQKQVTTHFLYDLNFDSELRYGILNVHEIFLSFCGAACDDNSTVHALSTLSDATAI